MKLIVIRGLPGSGKSTLAEKLVAANQHTAHYDNDMFFGDQYYRWTKALNQQAIVWCQGQVARALYNGYNAIVANTFTRIRYIDPYKEMARVFGAEFEILEPDTPWAKDLSLCHAKTIHGVPFEHMRSMLEAWQELPEGYTK